MGYIEIKDFPRYYIHDDGEVWSGKYKRRLSHGITYGYHHVTLCKNNKKYTRRIHTLVLEHFIGKKPCGFEARHLDGNKDNNKLSNLRWGTKKENGEDKVEHGRSKINKGESHGISKLTEQDVRMIIYMYKTGDFTQREIAEIYKIHQVHVSRIIMKKRWKHIWQK